MSEGRVFTLDRAEEALAEARHLLSGGFPAGAISRAYYAAFYAAGTALTQLGVTRSKHSGVHSAFGQLVVKEGGFDPALGAVLRRLFGDRTEVDYGPVGRAEERAERDIDDAERFVAAVREWLARRAGD